MTRHHLAPANEVDADVDDGPLQVADGVLHSVGVSLQSGKGVLDDLFGNGSIECDRGGEAQETGAMLDVQRLDIDLDRSVCDHAQQRVHRTLHRHGVCFHIHDLTASMAKSFQIDAR